MLGKVRAETEMSGLRSTPCVRGTIKRPPGAAGGSPPGRWGWKCSRGWSGGSA